MKYRLLTLISFAIRAHLIPFQLQQALDGSLVLRRSPLGGCVVAAPVHCSDASLEGGATMRSLSAKGEGEVSE